MLRTDTDTPTKPQSGLCFSAAESPLYHFRFQRSLSYATHNGRGMKFTSREEIAVAHGEYPYGFSGRNSLS